METLHNTYDAMERLLTPKGRFIWYAYDALTYIGACVETCRGHVPML